MSRRLDSLALRGARALARAAPGYATAGLRAPIFVIGCGRSGSTLLRRTLGRHPALAVLPSEGNELWHPHLYPWHARSEVPPLWIDPVAFTQASAERRTPDDVRWLEAVFGGYRRLRKGMQAHARFVNKTEMIHFMLPDVVEWFPSAVFVHLVRDGRGVALSRARRLEAPTSETAGLDLADWMPDFSDLADLLDRSIVYWQRSLDSIDEAARTLELGPDRLLEVRYEELCARPRSVLRSLAGFLGIDPRPFDALDPAGFSDMNHKYLSELSGERIARLSELGQRGLEGRGYAIEVPA